MADGDIPDVTETPEAGLAAQNQRPRRPGLRALLIGCVGVVTLLAAGAGALTFLGSAADGGPKVSLKLTAFARAPAESGGRTPSFVNTRAAGGNLVADPLLIEDSSEGPLPVIAPDGRTPMTVYAQAFDRNGKRPKIAIVIQGLGVGTQATELALKTLPPPVTLAFVPFTTDVQASVDKARGGGHEVLLQVPMEPPDFPDSDPGPHALLVGASAEENVKRLNWAMSRFTGYVGIANLLGGRFLGEVGAIEPVLAEAAKRGLLFFDDGATSRSLSATAARHANATIATGTLVLDTVQTRAAIDNKLVQLEAQATRDGFAIGVASLYPVTMTRVAQWAGNASARGFELVPITALAAKPQATASASAQ
jgi:polysaccharide deacetylase 2 family uncharacterized protein YibQ